MAMSVDHLDPGSARCVGRAHHEHTVDRQPDRSGDVDLGITVRSMTSQIR